MKNANKSDCGHGAFCVPHMHFPDPSACIKQSISYVLNALHVQSGMYNKRYVIQCNLGTPRLIKAKLNTPKTKRTQWTGTREMWKLLIVFPIKRNNNMIVLWKIEYFICANQYCVHFEYFFFFPPPSHLCPSQPARHSHAITATVTIHCVSAFAGMGNSIFCIHSFIYLSFVHKIHRHNINSKL